MTEPSPRPRVLVVTPWFPSEREPGAGSFVLRDVERLAERADITVIHVGAPQFFGPDPNTETQYAGFRVLRQPFAVTDYAGWARAARLVARELKHADVLHTMAFPGLAPFRTVRVGVPWLHTEHFSGLLKPVTGAGRSRLIQNDLRKQLARPDRVVAVSQYLADGLRPLRGDEIAIIGNAVPPIDASEIRPDAGADQDPIAVPQPIRMLGVGRVTEEKGAHDALETLIELRARGVEATLHWVGTGPLEERLAERAAETGVADAFTLVGALPMAEVARALAAADLFLLPTRTETFGVALAEAFSAGLPIVTGDRGGFMDFLDPESSRTIPIAELSGQSLAEGVVDLWNAADRPARAEIAARARRRFDEDERIEAYAREYERLGVPLAPTPAIVDPVFRSAAAVSALPASSVAGLTATAPAAAAPAPAAAAPAAAASFAEPPLAGSRIAFLLRGVIANDARVIRAATAARDAGAECVIFYRPGVTGDQGAVPAVFPVEVADMSGWGVAFQQRDVRAKRYVWLPVQRPGAVGLLRRLPKVGNTVANWLSDRQLARRLGRELTARGVDLVHAHDANTLALARRATAGRIPFVYDSHEMWRGNYSRPPKGLLKRYMRAVESKGVAASSALITVSPSILRWLVGEYRYGRPAVLVRNTPESDGALPEVQSMRARMGIPAETRLICYGGAVLPNRGIREAIDALPLLPDDVTLVVIGYGDDDYFTALRERAERAGVSDRLRFYGTVPYTELVAHIAQVDVSLVCIQPISPSYRFSLPNKLFESVQARVPVVASDLPDLADLVESNHIGRIVHEWDAASLAAATLEVLGGRESYASALDAAAERLNWRVESRALIGLYAQLLGRSTR